MKKLIITILLFLPLTLMAAGLSMSGLGPIVAEEGGAGGPDTWYYAGGSDNYTQSEVINLTDQGFFAGVTVSAGSLTKVSVKLSTTTAGESYYKIGVYTGTPSSLTLQQCVTVHIPTGTAAGWYDETLVTPINVSTGTVYLSLHATGDYGGTYYNATGGYWIYDTYANACQSSEASDGEDYLPAVRCYVD